MVIVDRGDHGETARQAADLAERRTKNAAVPCGCAFGGGPRPQAEVTVDSAKKKRLERASWVVGDTARFLDLSPEEARFLELKLLTALSTRPFRQVDVERIRIGVVVELHGLNPRSGNAL